MSEKFKKKDPEIVEVETRDKDKTVKFKPEQVTRRGKELTVIFGGTVHTIHESNIDNPKAESVLESQEVKNMSAAELEDLIAKLGGRLAQKKEQTENKFRVLNERGEPVEIMDLPDDIGDEFYVEVISDSEQKILPYKKLVKIEGEERGWGEEVAPGKVQQIQEQNIKVGRVDRVNKTISFSEKPSRDAESSDKLIREEDLQHIIPLLETNYKINKPTSENITPQILRHIADKIQLDISDETVAERLRKEILELNY